MHISELEGMGIGSRTHRYSAKDAAFYALAVGAKADQLDLVYERDLHVLPTFGAALGIWATSEAARRGGYDESTVLHAGQSLDALRPLPPEGAINMDARVARVYDKVTAALVVVVVESEYFRATYRMFVPGQGGWGGERGSSAPSPEDLAWNTTSEISVGQTAAALYRLTGDLHPVHIDPVVAVRSGLRGPILHGLCAMGMVSLSVAAETNAHPWGLTRIEATFRAPVYPGQIISVESAHNGDGGVYFRAAAEGTHVMLGRAEFRRPVDGSRS